MTPEGLPPGRVLPRPGPVWGGYPRRPPELALGVGAAGPSTLRWRLPSLARASVCWQARLATLEPQAFRGALASIRRRLRAEGLAGDALAAALGAASLMAERVLGCDPRDNQRRAAAAMALGALAEMATGEGKTLAIALAAAVGGLAGVPVHVVTANGYLAGRDAARMQPLFAMLGLVAGALPDTPVDDAASRRAAWAADIVYTTAADLAFDYLRDQLSPADDARAEPPRLRGLCMVLIDEADSVLLDEADMPLILSRLAPHLARRAFLWQALALARKLDPALDLRLSGETGSAAASVALTAAGERRVEALARPLGGPWQRPRYRREAIVLALQALHVHARDEHYVVRDREIQLLDAVTGRVAAGRVWSRGLHTLVALKEGVCPPTEQETVIQITFQRFFRRYWRMGGISGTLREARAELAATYGLPVVAIAPHRRSRAVAGPPRHFTSPQALEAALAARVASLRSTGRPVLVGTDSIEASHRLGAVLAAAGIEHVVLTALNDAEEASIVAGAGLPGRVTVATRVAGRGTDIALDPAARAAGGLHVLCCQRNPSRRLDRQLNGRAARGGDPGSYESWQAPADRERPGDGASPAKACRSAEYSMDGLGGAADKLGSWLRRPLISSRDWLLHLAHRLHQRREESRRAAARRELLRQDTAWEERLVFSAPPSSSR